MRRLQKRLLRKTSRRRYIRYGILLGNVVLLGGVFWFVLQKPSSNNNLSAGVNVSSDSTSVTPLDQLSSADIAVTLARMANLPETKSVVNRADSVSAELSVPSTDKVIVAKPQEAATSLKSRSDIQTYVVVGGDTVTSIAAKFNVTSDSVRGSNGLTSDSVAAGTKLFIPPINGYVYTVKNGDTPDTLAQKYRTTKDQIVAFNDAEIGGLKVGDQILIPGAQQPVVSRSFDSGFFGGSPIFGGGNNPYDGGYCTYYAFARRLQLGKPVPGNLGDAYTWATRAASFGIDTGPTPRAGDVAVKHSYRPGHVGIVEVVNGDGSFWMSEMNSYGQRSMTDSSPYGGFGKVDWKVIPASAVSSYSFIH